MKINGKINGFLLGGSILFFILLIFFLFTYQDKLATFIIGIIAVISLGLAFLE